MGNKNLPQEMLPIFETSPYTITIERASWGLNCRTPNYDKNADNYLQPNNPNNKGVENNVLFAVSSICNVRSSCIIPINTEVLGQDPIPTCGYKNLQIEYRCFSVDRLRTIKGTEGEIIIDCDKQLSDLEK